MADSTDYIIREYLTGNLDRKIQARTLMLSSHKPTENIGGVMSHDNVAPQERLLERIDSDDKLNQWKKQKILVELWLSSIDKVTHDILVYRFKYDLQWWQVAKSMKMGESSVRWRYQGFKEMVTRWSN